MIQRIEREAGTPLLAALAERVPLTDLQSLLLEVYRSRAAGIAASSLLERYSKNRFVAPSGLDPLSMLEFDRLVFKLLPVGFEALELSPVCPLGTVAAVANLDQNSVVTTIRNTEVVADATNVLALECARSASTSACWGCAQQGVTRDRSASRRRAWSNRRPSTCVSSPKQASSVMRSMACA